MKMRLGWMLLPMLLLGACSSGPKKEAPIRALGDADAPTAAPTPAPQPVKAQTSQPAQTQSLAMGEIKATPLSGAAPAESKAAGAPSAPLAKPGEHIIRFEYDSAVLPATAQPLLEQHAAWVRARSERKTLIQGHADERGSREYNLALGQKRAEGVRQALSLMGVPDTRMEAVSLGEEKPLAEGSQEEAWRQNRRAEIYYPGE